MQQPVKPKDEIILSAALTAFSRYGYARTTMADIAKDSGMARTALYKTFSNKADIFRSLAEVVHQQALQAARDALADSSEFPQRLENALIARDVHLLTIGHTGPHADEIAGLYLSLAGELAAQFNDDLVALLAAAIGDAKQAEGYQIPAAFSSAHDLARLLRLALEGVKKEVKSADKFERLARQLISAMI